MYKVPTALPVNHRKENVTFSNTVSSPAFSHFFWCTIDESALVIFLLILEKQEWGGLSCIGGGGKGIED
jgi:hypothetical protein